MILRVVLHNTIVVLKSYANLLLATNQTERLRIKSDGGILQTKTGGNANYTISRNESVGTTDQAIGVLDFASNTGHTVQARVMGKTRGTNNVGGDLIFETRPDNGSLDEKVRITGDGRLGIGTDNPDHHLHVHNSSGDSIVTIESKGNGKHSALEFHRTSAGGDSKGAGSIYVTGDTSATEAKMKFAVGHNVDHQYTPSMVIMGNGEVGIGTENPDTLV